MASKKYFYGNIEDITIENTNYRNVLWTKKDTGSLQLVVMSLKPLEAIDAETHSHTTQFIRVERGRGQAILGKDTLTLKSGDAIIIPPGTKHTIINKSKTKSLKLYTLYSPAEHKAGLIQTFK